MVITSTNVRTRKGVRNSCNSWLLQLLRVVAAGLDLMSAEMQTLTPPERLSAEEFILSITSNDQSEEVETSLSNKDVCTNLDTNRIWTAYLMDEHTASKQQRRRPHLKLSDS